MSPADEPGSGPDLSPANRWARRISDWLSSGPFAGLLAGLVLFAWGAASLNDLSYLGQGTEEIKRIAIQAYGPSVVREHVKILALYLALGLAGGLIATGLCALRDHLRGRRPRSRLWRLGRYTLLLSGVHLFFFARSVVVYPQLYAEYLYDRGGLRRQIQVGLTDHFSPRLLDALMLLSLVLFVGSPLVRVIRARAWHWQRPPLRRLLGWATSLGLVTVALVSLAVATGPRQAHQNKGPNVLIIAVDSLRGDHLEGPRYRRVAPRLHRLSRQGVSFSHAYVTLARTFPSWLTMLSGREPHSHGIRHMFPSWEARRRVGLTLPLHLRRAGYETAVVSDYAGEIFGRVPLGFHHQDVSSFTFYEIVRQRVLKGHAHLMPYLATGPGRQLAPPMTGMPENADPHIMARQVNRMLTRVAAKPRFFMVAFFSASHFPYSAPYPYYQRYTSRHYRGPVRYHKQLLLKERPPTAADIQHIRQLYDGTVAAADDAIGRVLDHLQTLGIADKTIVVITADHGENLYEPTLGMGHGDHLRGDVATRQPLVIYDPVHRVTPRRVGDIVRDVDLAPTLAALVGRPLPGPLAGRSLRPLMQGRPGRADRAAFMETGLWFTPKPQGVDASLRMSYPPVLHGLVSLDQKRRGDLVLNPRYETLVVAAKHRAIRTRRWKLIYVPLASGVRHQLFDVQADPHCTRDVAAKHPAVTKRLVTRLRRWMRGAPGSLRVGDWVLPGQGGLTP
jgi:arylsulfatase A-like enzyme